MDRMQRQSPQQGRQLNDPRVGRSDLPPAVPGHQVTRQDQLFPLPVQPAWPGPPSGSRSSIAARASCMSGGHADGTAGQLRARNCQARSSRRHPELPRLGRVGGDFGMINSSGSVVVVASLASNSELPFTACVGWDVRGFSSMRLCMDGWMMSHMNARRSVLGGTAGVVAVLAVVLVFLRWDDANKVAVVVSSLAAVAAVGVAIWAALPAVSGRGIWVSRTGKATAGRGGRANTGLSGSPGAVSGESRVDRTGDAKAPEGGDANTGIDLS
jgi:hypothetical protein